MAMQGELNRIVSISKAEGMLKQNDEKAVVQETISGYRQLFDEKKGGGVEARQNNYMSMVNSFYNMITDFYEFGWGQSFHFAPRHKMEDFSASIARHEMYLAHKMGLKSGMTVVDLGCGVGGPGRCMARFSEANIIGINNNDYQIERCKKLTKAQGLSHLCAYAKSDFNHLPFDDETQDAAFHVEALCHSHDKVTTFKEVYRTLKPGAVFAGYDWVITDKYDANNSEHVRIKKDIELGNALPELLLPSTIVDCLKEAGFEVIEHKDVALFDPEYEISWFDSLGGHLSLSGFKHTPLGIWLTHKMVWMLESLKIAPKGTLDIHGLLVKTAGDLVEGGKTGIFSPCYFYLCRKPE